MMNLNQEMHIILVLYVSSLVKIYIYKFGIILLRLRIDTDVKYTITNEISKIILYPTSAKKRYLKKILISIFFSFFSETIGTKHK